MKAVTGNRLADGVVVYLGQNDEWTERLADAVIFEGAAADDALARASAQKTFLAGAYLIDAEAGGGDRPCSAARDHSQLRPHGAGRSWQTG